MRYFLRLSFMPSLVGSLSCLFSPVNCTIRLPINRASSHTLLFHWLFVLRTFCSIERASPLPWPWYAISLSPPHISWPASLFQLSQLALKVKLSLTSSKGEVWVSSGCIYSSAFNLSLYFNLELLFLLLQSLSLLLPIFTRFKLNTHTECLWSLGCVVVGMNLFFRLFLQFCGFYLFSWHPLI